MAERPNPNTLDSDYKRYAIRSAKISRVKHSARPKPTEAEANCSANSVIFRRLSLSDFGPAWTTGLEEPRGGSKHKSHHNFSSASCFPFRWKRRRRSRSKAAQTDREEESSPSLAREETTALDAHYLRDGRDSLVFPGAGEEPEREAALQEVTDGLGGVSVADEADVVVDGVGALTAHKGDAHSQVEYRHYLISGQWEISSMPAYWGVIDRYQAETVLEDKPEGSFLLRDSAQDDFVFSVSFRRFKRTLHARLEITSHRYTFDSHDPNIFAAPSVSVLLEHYKDPVNCMFYQPMCCSAVPRRDVFSLQDLCRAKICTMTSYDGLAALPLPRKFLSYLRYYHYKVPIRSSYLGS